MKWISVVLGLALPILIFAGLKWLEPRAVAVLIGGIALLRLLPACKRLSRGHRTRLLAAAACVALPILLTAVFNEARYLLALPALVHLALLGSFGWSFFRPPSIVEVFARAQAGDLSVEEVAYCRSVTGVWCLFFLGNGGVIAWLSLTASPAAWALYTGFLSYLLIGALFAVEFVYRHYRFRRYIGAPTDPLLKRIFPPREAC